jgi:ribonuclease-3
MGADRKPDEAALEERLGHRFREPELLARALTHSSWAHEHGSAADNEPLEFLGDALLGFLVAEALCARFPDADEGTLSKMKAYLVSRGSLARVAHDLDLGSHLRLGRASRVEGRARDTLLADGLEAVVAAVHLDGGDAAGRALVTRLFGPRMEGLDRAEAERQDAKTALQEALQAAGRPAPHYRVGATEGPAHRPTFQVDLLVEGTVVAKGEGGSKKEAEQKAARKALLLIRRAAPRGKR